MYKQGKLKLLITIINKFFTDENELSISSQAGSSSFQSPTLINKLNKKRKTNNQTYAKEELLKKAETALNHLTAANTGETKENDGLHHWVLYLESELREIKDKKKLKKIQRNILDIVMVENDD